MPTAAPGRASRPAARSTGTTSASATTARSPVAASPSARRSRSPLRSRACWPRTSKPDPVRTTGRGPEDRGAGLPPTLLSGFTALARDVVPDEVIEVQRAQRLGHVAVSGVDRVVDQHGQMGDVPPGLGRMPLGSLSRREGAQQLPEKLHVDVVQRAPYGEVMQLTRGQRVQFITGHPWTLPPAPCGSRGATSSWGRAVTTPERADGP